MKWIKADEARPAGGTTYLCRVRHVKAGILGASETVLLYAWTNGDWNAPASMLVTHYMPLPSPPEDE